MVKKDPSQEFLISNSGRGSQNLRSGPVESWANSLRDFFTMAPSTVFSASHTCWHFVFTISLEGSHTHSEGLKPREGFRLMSERSGIWTPSSQLQVCKGHRKHLGERRCPYSDTPFAPRPVVRGCSRGWRPCPESLPLAQFLCTGHALIQVLKVSSAGLP